jgi:hypothetical protein
MATQRTPRNSGHLSVADTLAAKATPPAAAGGSPRYLPQLNSMRAPPPPPPVNRPVMPPGGAVSAGPPPALGALQAPQAGAPTDLRAILAQLFRGGGGGSLG